MSFLDDVDGLVLDMDGVLYRGDEPIAGVPETMSTLRDRDLGLVFCTNNSSRTPQQYVERLEGMGIQASSDEIVTSATATAAVLEERGMRGAKAIVIGRDGVRRALAELDITIEDDPEVRSADVVVVGFDTAFDFEALKRASIAVRSGALFIATNGDPTFPHSQGLWPGAGSILAAVETAAGRKAEVMGKPNRPMLAEASKRLGDPRRIAMVGDRPDTDLAGAVAMGWSTVLVLSGVADSADGVQPTPDLVLGSLADLPDQ
jgi:4-nitrophenyl phosphatase